MNKINSNGRIKFTMEAEKDCKLPFLDCLLHRSCEGIQMSVYHKPTDSGRYTNFKSFQPVQHKIGTISNLVRRNLQISSKLDSVKSKETLLQRF